MIKDKLFNEKVESLEDKRTAYQFIKDNFQSIEKLRDKGYSKKNITHIINEEGYDIKYDTFLKYFAKINRKYDLSKTNRDAQLSTDITTNNNTSTHDKKTKEKTENSNEKPKKLIEEEEEKDYDISKLNEHEQKVASYIYRGIPYTENGDPCFGGAIGMSARKTKDGSKPNIKNNP